MSIVSTPIFAIEEAFSVFFPSLVGVVILLWKSGVVVGTCEGFAPIKKLNKESLYPLPLKSLHKEQTSYLFNQAL